MGGRQAFGDLRKQLAVAGRCSTHARLRRMPLQKAAAVPSSWPCRCCFDGCLMSTVDWLWALIHTLEQSLLVPCLCLLIISLSNRPSWVRV